MNGIKTGLGITPGEHIISADSALSRNIRHCFCLSCHGRLILQTDAQGAWFEHDLHALSEQQKGKRAARTVLTGMCYSVGSATRQGSSSPTRFIGQSAMTPCVTGRYSNRLNYRSTEFFYNHRFYDRLTAKFDAWQFPTLAWGDPTLPSALRRFTSEFGMGSGGTTAIDRL